MQVNNIIAHHKGIDSIRKGIIPLPKFADLHTSNKCNHNCIGCAYRNHLTSDIMSEKEHVNIIGQLLDVGVEAFDFSGGGEPLMLPYITNIFDIIKGEGRYYGLITNGSFLNEELAYKLSEQATYIRVSLEASCRADYESYKRVGPKEWDKVISNIKRLVSIKNKTCSKCEIGIKFSVGKSLRGYSHYKNATDLGLDLGVDNIQFKALRHEPEELCLIDKHVEEELILQYDDICGFIRYWIVPEKDAYVPQCNLNPLHTVVDYKGDVYLCCYYYYRPETHLIGNMLNNEFLSFWGKAQHAEKIKNIDRRECMKVDCKFFRHHRIADEQLVRGKVSWL